MAVAEPEKAAELDVNSYENSYQKRNTVVTTAIEKAKAKNARLRLMKERNENYLAERRDEIDADEELTKELRGLATE